jgi:kinesin family protein 4/21/27
MTPVGQPPPHVTPTNQDDRTINNNNSPNHNPLSSETTTETTGTASTPVPPIPVVTETGLVAEQDHEPVPLLTEEGRDASCVQVAVRVRPSLPGEAKDCVISVDTERSAVQVYGEGGPRFTFDKVLPPTVSQSLVFETVVQPLVDKTLQGYNATIFAYGQTGSGKTYTILGPAEAWMGSGSSSSTTNHAPPTSSSQSQPQHAPSTGLLPRAVYALFEGLATQQQATDTVNSGSYSYTVTLQFLEVYGDEIRDLLGHGMMGQGKLTVREYHDEPEVVGAECMTCPTAAHAIKAVAQGSLRRVTAATAMNATSSRSHALLTVGVRQEWRNVNGDGDDDSDNNNNTIVKQSKFHFCDLAGSERQKRTLAEGQRLKEGIHINQGLLVLGNVISALASQSSHVPYRDSKLTRLLRGSLGGNHQTLMIACVAGNQANVDESLNCLRYANRAKNIRNSAVVNLDANSKRLLELQSHIVRLAQSLELVLSAVTTDSQNSTQDDNDAKKEEAKENVDWPAILAQIPYSREALQMMVAGGQSQVRDIDKTSAAASSVVVPSPTKSLAPVMASSPSNQSTSQHQSSPMPRTPREDYRLHELEGRIHALERELVNTQKRLEESQEYHDAAEVELHRYRALERIMSSADPNDPAGTSTITESSFLEQATAYEQEISFLRKELQAAERKANRFALWQNANPQQEEQRFQAAEALLQQDRIRLRQLQSSASVGESSTDQTMVPTPAGTASPDLLDDEVQAEQADLEEMTKKYLAQGGHVDEDDYVDGREDAAPATASPGDKDDPSVAEASSISRLTGMPMQIKHLHMENDLLSLSKSIEEREKLIQELKDNQEKFASMREFYEEKLSKMEAELLEKEHEREQLAKQLETAKTRGSTQDIQNRLHEKDLYIDSLRRKQKELRNLTNVSHRNELDIARLQKDVTEMKRKRADMQKQLAAERKQHAVEVKELQKTATQKEREIHKLQKISNQREMQAQKAGQVAKARLEELNILRAKNKEVEKKLRMQTVKRGMMQKAGIDSVLVGQRVGRQNKTQSGKSAKRMASTVDVDQLQTLFDKKISDVVQREALADKLAEEWEEHYDLTEKKQELLAADRQEAEEDIQALSMKILYKQNRIRQLAKKLGKESQTGGRKSGGDYDLFDEQFHALCKGMSKRSFVKHFLLCELLQAFLAYLFSL